MKRKIITIDENLCNGCGDCVTGCSEGALQIINGKAKLVREDFCDGFGDCIGHCPTGALKIEEKEVASFDEEAVKSHLRKTQGEEAVIKMQEAQKRHSHDHDHSHGHGHTGCPGSQMTSKLNQWPIQLHLVPPAAPFFKNKEMLVLSTCSPVASPSLHAKYIEGRSLVVACPKLDRTDPYVSKLAQILSEPSIPKVIAVIMEVPCCRGLAGMVQAAAAMTGREDLKIEIHVLTLDGKLKEAVKVNR